MDFSCWSFFHYDTRYQREGEETQHRAMTSLVMDQAATLHTVIFWFPGSSYFDILSITVSVTFTLQNSQNIYWQLK